MTRVFTAFILLVFCLRCIAQERVEYTSEFSFKDGVYLSFQDFKNNNPVPLTHIISDFDIRNPNYLTRVLEQDTVYYYDNLYEERSVAADDLWGFSNQGRVQIAHNLVWSKKKKIKDIVFVPLNTIGKVCFYAAEQYVYRSLLDSPEIGMFSDSYYTDESYTRERVPVFMLVEFETGDLILSSQSIVSDFVTETVYRLLESDESLLREFASLPMKQQRKQAMFFLKRYNERNPIFFPINN